MTDRSVEGVGTVPERKLFVDGPVVVFRWRNEAGWPVEYVSPNVERLFGYSAAELYDGDPPYAELVHDDDLDRVIREVRESGDAGAERFHHEPYRLVTRDGAARWVLDYTTILRDDGAITGYTGYLVDITERRAKIEYANALNAVIRSLHEVLIDADSRAEIYENVCDAPVELDGFAGCWIGTADSSADELAVAARARVPDAYLGSIPRSLDEDSPVPAVRVGANRSDTGEHCVSDQAPDETWREAALANGFRSAFAVPIRHRELHYGVLTVYGTGSDTFDTRIREILMELGTLVGYAVTAVERQNALHGDGSRDLVLEVAIDDDDPLRSLASRLSNTVDVRSVSQWKQDDLLLYCLLPDVDPERAVDAADAVGGLESTEALSNGDAPIYEVFPAEPCVASKVIALGARLQSLRISERTCELVVSVRRERDQRRFVGQVDALFGGADLIAERAATPPEPMPWTGLLADTLTERQRTVLKAAYHAGYFDGNRKLTGAEIADALGIAQPTFSAHMRAAQRNLLSAIWDCPNE
ncbi:MAG: bacterio-opsin activator domain-containing protein [Halobacteriota archaeon]|uniref:bacterio-opsin activator domain-containing protein n=1 Tax=Natronomonas sp. TaxID=2184060 RepID=UPI0039760318